MGIMSKKTDFSAALRTTAAKQKTVIEDRFSRADSVLLNPPVDVPVATAPKEPVIRDTFSMPANDHAIIEKLRLIAANSGTLVNKSGIVRCALILLDEVGSAELLKLLANMPARK